MNADDLYALPLEEFTAARDRAARELRKADREAAAALAKLPKPTPAAWTANQVAREQPDLMEALLEAGEDLRAAQEEALSGGGAGGLRDAMAAQRRAVDAVMTAAQSYRPAGRPLSRAMADRLRTTLQAAAGDEALSAALGAGRLVDEAAAGGAWAFGAELAGAEEARPRARAKKAAAKPAAPREEPGDDSSEAAAREAAAAAERAALEAELKQARGNLRVRERTATAAAREADAARMAVETAAARLEKAQKAAEEAREDAEAAQRAAEEAGQALAAARDEVARLEERLD